MKSVGVQKISLGEVSQDSKVCENHGRHPLSAVNQVLSLVFRQILGSAGFVI